MPGLKLILVRGAPDLIDRTRDYFFNHELIILKKAMLLLCHISHTSTNSELNSNHLVSELKENPLYPQIKLSPASVVHLPF